MIQIELPAETKIKVNDTTFVVGAIYETVGEDVTEKIEQLLKHEIYKTAYE